MSDGMSPEEIAIQRGYGPTLIGHLRWHLVPDVDRMYEAKVVDGVTLTLVRPADPSGLWTLGYENAVNGVDDVMEFVDRDSAEQVAAVIWRRYRACEAEALGGVEAFTEQPLSHPDARP